MQLYEPAFVQSSVSLGTHSLCKTQSWACISAALEQSRKQTNPNSSTKKTPKPLKTYPVLSHIMAIKVAVRRLSIMRQRTFSQVMYYRSTSAQQTKHSFKNLTVISEEEKLWTPL